MRLHPLAVVTALALGASACAARAAAPVPEPELPRMVPPPAPARIVAVYMEPVDTPPIEMTPAAEPVSPTPPPPRPAAPPPAPAPEAKPGTATPTPPPALTLTPVAGSEGKTEASIRTLLARASRDLARVNTSGLSADGRTQFDVARRFVQQAEEALKARNLVYAGKLADKAAVMAAVLVR
ncbi:MAG: hypothetical protein R2712_15880 [Vicinamibacterales bacterium]